MSLWLPEKLYNEMSTEAALWSPLETGGIFLGYVSDSNEVVVTALVHAGPAARRTKWSFRPDGDFQNEGIAKQYAASGRRDLYLGDWHTHPGGSANMSWRDRRTLQAIAQSPEARIANPIMMILHDHKWKVATWQFSRKSILASAPCVPLQTEIFASESD
jgi:integrative and conjugative element protein (TIGR02256 family)